MAGPKLFDRVKDSTTTTGTGTLTLANSAPTGFQTFGSVLSNGDTCLYTISSSGGSEWECGVGTYTSSGTTLARTTVLASSNSGSAVNLSAGTKDVYIAPLGEMLTDQSGIQLTNNFLAVGRLTLTSGVPVTTTDVTGATSVYFTPYNGNQINVYSGSRWKFYTFSELTLAVGTLVNATNYDVFLYDNSGTLTLCFGPAWSSGTTRGTGAGTTELVLQDGVYVNNVSLSGGPGAKAGRYLGTIRTTATTTTEDSAAKRFLWNTQNRVERPVKIYDSTASWSYGSTTWRQANANTANQVALVVGIAGWSTIDMVLWADHTIAGNQVLYTAFGEDSTTAPSFAMVSNYINTNGDFAHTIRIATQPALGYHYYAWLEATSGPSVTTTGKNTGPASADNLAGSGVYGTWQS